MRNGNSSCRSLIIGSLQAGNYSKFPSAEILLCSPIRAFALYSMVDGSRQGFSAVSEEKKKLAYLIAVNNNSLAFACRRKKEKKRSKITKQCVIPNTLGYREVLNA